MASQLLTECLDEILKYLEDDKHTLYLCLLVNRFWCKIAVRILWRSIWDFENFQRRSSILSTLIACLPNESKDLLYKHKIFISAPTSNSPLFNYPEFCKVLSINEITSIVRNVLNDRVYLVANEIIKMFTNQVSALKKFTYFYDHLHNNITLPYVPGARNLSELCCSSDIPSDFFYQLSQICHNLQSITILFSKRVSIELKGLNELISSQNNLKNLTLLDYNSSSANIIPAIIKHSHTITKLRLHSEYKLKFSFVSSLINLQEFIFSFGIFFVDFDKLQYFNFAKLEILKIPHQFHKTEDMIKLLENNGKNLKKLYISQNNKALSLSIANFCPKITSLYVMFDEGEIDILKTILIGCKYLESIKVWCGYHYLNEKEVLNTILNYSSNNFHELKIDFRFNISPEDLESFFISWKTASTPKNPLSLIFIDLYICEENLDILEKYKNLGIVKFWIKGCKEEEIDEGLNFYY
jgi:hypothetical protein